MPGRPPRRFEKREHFGFFKSPISTFSIFLFFSLPSSGARFKETRGEAMWGEKHSEVAGFPYLSIAFSSRLLLSFSFSSAGDCESETERRPGQTKRGVKHSLHLHSAQQIVFRASRWRGLENSKERDNADIWSGQKREEKFPGGCAGVPIKASDED